MYITARLIQKSVIHDTLPTIPPQVHRMPPVQNSKTGKLKKKKKSELSKFKIHLGQISSEHDVPCKTFVHRFDQKKKKKTH